MNYISHTNNYNYNNNDSKNNNSLGFHFYETQKFILNKYFR